MGISVFEAAAVYDFHTIQNPSVPIHSIVFDTDTYSVGFCTCNKGKAELIGSYAFGENHNFVEDMINEISKIANGATKDSIREAFSEQMSTLNKQVRRYLRSERQVDGIAMQWLDLSVRCAELEKAFQVAKEKWDNVFLQMDRLWNISKFEEEDVRIIMVGTSANWYLVEFYIRSQLSFDPFLLDERFVNVFYKDNAEQIVEIGRRFFEETNVLGMDIHVVLMDTEC